MSEDNIISRKGKKIIITMKAFQSQRPRHSIRQLSIFLSNASKYLATEDWFGPPQKATDLENFMRKNFRLTKFTKNTKNHKLFLRRNRESKFLKF